MTWRPARLIWWYVWILLNRLFEFSLGRSDSDWFFVSLEFTNQIKQKHFVWVVRRISRTFAWSWPSTKILRFTNVRIFENFVRIECSSVLSESNVWVFCLSLMFWWSCSNMSLNGKGKRRLHIRTVTGKYKILKKMTKENCVLEYHTNMEFGNKRSLDGLKKNLRFMMKQRKTELQRKK